MDRQRAGRVGLANFYFVVKVQDADVLAELAKVQRECAALYDGFERCAASLDHLHVTLVAAHSPSAATAAQLRAALMSFVFTRFELSLRGLGSWTTAGGKHVLFAEVEEGDECAEFARALSQNVRESCKADEEGCFAERTAWVDVVQPETFQAHVSLATVDPAEETAIAKAMQAKSGTAKQGDKPKRKLSARDKAKEGRREQIMEMRQQEQKETFGREHALFRHERRAFRKITFGVVPVECVHLESCFQPVAVQHCKIPEQYIRD
jgi:2'-5' RNA ligase